MLRYTFVVASLSIVLSSAMSQEQVEGFTCKTNDPSFVERMFQDRPEDLLRTHDAKMELDQWTAGSVRGGGDSFVIPVVFHIIHTYGAENISDAQVADAIRVLNEDFNKQNPDWTTVRPQFIDRVADVGIRFELAKRDPGGNCTNGITRTISDLTNEGDFAMTQLIQWPRERYMNVWVGAQANGAAGYTNYPWVLDGSPNSDGIVIQSSYVGRIGTSSPGRSRVLSHEVGHWLNLMHCWGNSNDPGLPENCFEDDNVDDTPLTRGWTSCSLSGSSCGSELDNVENYMEYSYCGKMFTQGQGDRMIAALTSSIADRSQLWQEGNLALTGVLDELVLCNVSLVADREQVCVGETVSFIDLSYNAVSQRTWLFPGGEPSTSSDSIPVVNYPTMGTYPVTLIVSDGTTTLSSGEALTIKVLPNPGYEIPWTEGFESISSISGTDWTAVDIEQNGFEVTPLVASTGSQSVRLSNGPGRRGKTSELISATFDLSAEEGISLSFKYAFAKRTALNEDLLRVRVSSDCGQTWSVRRQLSAASALSTGGIVAGSFVPDADEWVQNSITNFGQSLLTSDFRFKFEFISDGGNDLFLDDIQINGVAVSMDEYGSANPQFRIFPNPVNENAHVLLTMISSGQVQIDMVDLLGKAVAPPLLKWVGAGSHSMELPLADLSEGLYMMRVRTAGHEQVARFAVAR